MVKIITSFSAKGGAGSSVITANLAIYLAQKGKKVLLFDAAPNGGTLHCYLNIHVSEVSEVVPEHFSILPLVDTDYQNLKFFSNLVPYGSPVLVCDILQKWETELKKSSFDYLFIDMGSKITEDYLRTAYLTDLNLLFSTPDPVSIEKTNHLMRQFYKHQLKVVIDKFDLHHTLQDIQREKPEYLFTARNLLLLLSEAVPKNRKHIADIVNRLKVGLIYNNIKSTYDNELKTIYPLVIKNYFGFELAMLGEVLYSEVFQSSVTGSMPVVTNERSGEFIETLDAITNRITAALTRKEGFAND